MWLPLVCLPPGNLAHNPVMCPDWELNQRPVGSQAGTQSTEPHQPRLRGSFYGSDYPLPRYCVCARPSHQVLGTFFCGQGLHTVACLQHESPGTLWEIIQKDFISAKRSPMAVFFFPFCPNLLMPSPLQLVG